jgi:hypothetical protein
MERGFDVWFGWLLVPSTGASHLPELQHNAPPEALSILMERGGEAGVRSRRLRYSEWRSTKAEVEGRGMAALQGRLVERSGGRPGTAHLLTAEVTSLGRGADNDVVLLGHNVSRRHAEIRWLDGRYILHDLGSKNGLLLNGRRVAEPEPLADGDLIAIPGTPELLLAFDSGEDTVTVKPVAGAGSAIVIDPRTAELRVRGVPVRLTAKEYHGLALLYEKGGALVSKEEFAARVWPEFEGAVSDDSIEQVIHRLRRKLEENPEQPRHVLTVRGLGYRLVTS